MSALLNSLSEAELGLVRETERDRIEALDEDALVDLHTRIRRARTKYVTLYRRAASSKVDRFGGRGVARPKNQRNAGKAEVFEDALARVSRRLGVVARSSAAELKAERLESARREAANTPARRSNTAARPRNQAGRREQGTSARTRTPASRSASAKTADRRPASPALRKRQAATAAVGARRQAKRDAR